MKRTTDNENIISKSINRTLKYQSRDKFETSKNIFTSEKKNYSLLSLREKEESFNEFRQLDNIKEVQKLRKLFLLYSASEKTLFSKKFIKLLSDAKILDNNFDYIYADIIYSDGHSKHTVDFNQFCKIIVKVAKIKFTEEYAKNQTGALNKLLNKFLFPLLVANKSVKETFPINWDIYFTKLDSGMNPYYIIKHYYCISKIYQKYFSLEISNTSSFNKSNFSEAAFLKFCKDFEISPSVISLVKLKDIYQNILMNTNIITSRMKKIQYNKKSTQMSFVDISNQGSYFTLWHFVSSLYLISVFILIDTENYFICEQITKDSESFHQLIENFYQTESIKIIFPKEKLVSNIKTKIKNNETSRRSIKYSKTNQIENSDFNDIFRKNLEFYQPHKITLLSIYKFYSELFFDTNFSIFMNLSGFIKFMKDLGLINSYSDKKNTPINYSDGKNFKDVVQDNIFSYSFLNVLFKKNSSEKHKSNTSSDSSSNKINFSSFIKILCCLSNKLYSIKLKNLSDDDCKNNINIEMLQYLDKNNFELFIKNYLLKCYNDVSSFVKIKSVDLIFLDRLHSDPNLEAFYSEIKPVLSKLFMIYSDKRETLSLDQLIKFCYDFEIFPDLVSKNQIFQLFINLIKDFDNKNVIGGNPCLSIKSDQFTIIIFMIASECGQSQDESSDYGAFMKILNFFQRMNQSEGLKKINILTGSQKIFNDLTSVFNKHKSFIEEKPIFIKSFSELIKSINII